MKKYLIGFMLLLFVAAAYAGTIEDIQYKDKSCVGFWCNDNTRTTNDNDVFVDADTLDGETAEDLKDYSDVVASQAEDNAKDYADDVANEAERDAKRYAKYVANKAENDAKVFSVIGQ